MSQAFCSQCGAAHNADDRFCPSCGAPTGAPATPPDPTWNQPATQEATQEAIPAGPLPSTGNGNRIALILVASLVVLALGGVGLFFLLKKSPEQQIESAIRTQIQAIADQDCAKYADVTAGDRDEQIGECKEFSAEIKVQRVTIDKISIKGNTATAHVKIAYTRAGKPDTEDDTWSAKKVDGDWKID